MLKDLLFSPFFRFCSFQVMTQMSSRCIQLHIQSISISPIRVMMTAVRLENESTKATRRSMAVRIAQSIVKVNVTITVLGMLLLHFSFPSPVASQ